MLHIIQHNRLKWALTYKMEFGLFNNFLPAITPVITGTFSTNQNVVAKSILTYSRKSTGDTNIIKDGYVLLKLSIKPACTIPES